MAISKRDEGKKVNSNINVTPMVDVMLVLLIIFMVITPMLQKGVSVDLAKVNSPEAMPDADKEDALIVAVIPLGILRNGFRIMVIGWLCVRFGPGMINTPIHHQGGPLFFALSLIPFGVLLWLLRRREPAARVTPQS